VTVDPVTGTLALSARDVYLAAPLPFSLVRHYDSRRIVAGRFGVGWRSWLDETVVSHGANEWTWYAATGRSLALSAITVETMPLSGGTVEHPLLVRDARNRLALLEGPRRTMLAPDGAEPGTWRAERILRGEAWSIAVVRDAGRIIQLRTSWGVELAIDYTDVGLVEAIRMLGGSAAGALSRYRYDAARQLLEQEDAARQRQRYQYDDHLLVAMRPGAGESRFAGYDGMRRCVALWTVPDRAARRLAWDVARRQLLVTDESGRGTLLSYNPDAGVTESVAAGERRCTWQVASDGSLASESSDDHVEWTVLAPRANLRQLFDASGVCWAFEYSPAGMLTRLEDPLGHSWHWEYDDQDRLTRRLDPSGIETRWAWFDRRGFEVTDSSDNVLRVQLAPDLSTLQATDTSGLVARLEFDPSGRLVRGSREEMELVISRDDAGRVTRVAGPRADVDELESVSSSLVSSLEAVGLFDRDEMGRLVAVKLGELVRSRYGWDPLGRLSSVSESGIPIDYVYDEDGQLVEERYDGGAVRYRYDGAGRLAAVQGPSEVTCDLVRDARGRLVALRDSMLGLFEFRYRAGARLQTVRYPTGAEVEYGNGAMRVRAASGADAPLMAEPPAPHPADALAFAGLLACLTGEPCMLGHPERDASGRISAWVSEGNRIELEYDGAGTLTAATDRDRRLDIVVDFAGRLLGVGSSESGRSIVWSGRQPLEAHDRDGLAARWLHHPDLRVPLAEITRDGVRLLVPTADGRVLAVLDDGGTRQCDVLRPLQVPAVFHARGTSRAVLSSARTDRGVPEPGPHRLEVCFDPAALLERRLAAITPWPPPATDCSADLDWILAVLTDRQPRPRIPTGAAATGSWPPLDFETLAAVARAEQAK
jgi:YD repeat-containing protein